MPRWCAPRISSSQGSPTVTHSEHRYRDCIPLHSSPPAFLLFPVFATLPSILCCLKTCKLQSGLAIAFRVSPLLHRRLRQNIHKHLHTYVFTYLFLRLCVGTFCAFFEYLCPCVHHVDMLQCLLMCAAALQRVVCYTAWLQLWFVHLVAKSISCATLGC